MADRARIYVESCCYIDIAKQQLGVALPADRAADVWHLWRLLEAHKAKDVELYTSVLTVVECIHADGTIDDKTKSLFIRVLSAGQYVNFVQPTPFLASDARDLRWKHGINLSGGDYLHVASGLAVGCGEFLTTDAKIAGQATKIGGLGMKVVRPSATILLPTSYRQKDLLHENAVTPIRPKAGQAPPPAGG